MTNITTWLLTKIRGQLIGMDAYGNKYYQDNRVRDNGKCRRWVIYYGDVEASKVPAEWHAWLHYVVDIVPEKIHPYPWEKPHQRNLTGTKFAYRPSTWVMTGFVDVVDYEAWKPKP
jgi:NADH:ubiquinone oxidoreductase subunit